MPPGIASKHDDTAKDVALPKHKHPRAPERYRLSAARLAAAQRQSPATLIHFWFRTRYISALASTLSKLHPHVLDLHIKSSTAAHFIRSCVRLLPAFAQSWVQAVLLEWFLPDHVVLKMQKDSEPGEEAIQEEQFATEVEAYNQLKPLQGLVIPKCYGRLRYRGTRALLLEYLGGVSLSSPEGATLELEELSSLLQPCYRALSALGVHHDDPNLSNFRLVDGKVMILDLESCVFDMSADDRAHFMRTNICDLAYRYPSMQAYHWHEG